MSDLQQAIDKLRSSPHYKALATYEPPFNPFEIVGATHRELTHSSVLAWLLRDEANKEFRQKFIDKIATGKPELDLSVPNDPGDPRLKPEEVETEYSFEAGDRFDAGSIDVFVHFKSLKFVIGIEVKVNADEGPEQVKKYQKFLCQEYPDPYNKVIVFLTPGGYPSETKSSVPGVHVLEMSWSNIAWMIKKMQATLGGANKRDANNFRMQFSQHLERNIAMNEREEQRIVRKLLSEGDNEKTLHKIIGNMPLQGYSAQWKKIVAEVCCVKEESLEEKTLSQDGIVKELKICIPKWRNAGLPFTVMLYKYQNQKASVRILLHWTDCYEGKEFKAELKEFANLSNSVVNKEFPKLKKWTEWHSVLAKHKPDKEVKETLIDNIWSEDWEEKAEKRLREQIEDSGLLSQINEWIKTKGADKG